MKTKNVILGLCALVFAIGSAFATFDANTLADEKVEVITSATIEGCSSATLCVDINRTCSGTGFNCQATVFSTNLSGGSDPANVRNSTCANILTSSSSSLSGSYTNNCVNAVN